MSLKITPRRSEHVTGQLIIFIKLCFWRLFICLYLSDNTNFVCMCAQPQFKMTYHVDAVVILWTSISELNSMSLHIRKIFFRLFRGGGSQTCQTTWHSAPWCQRNNNLRNTKHYILVWKYNIYHELNTTPLHVHQFYEHVQFCVQL